MTTTLVLGGTAWLGREVARAALARGHEVTCLARGESGQAPADVEWVRADRSAPDGYAGVRDRPWDVVVDVSWQPGLVRSALDALGGRASHWVYVSSCSVYAEHVATDADESAALLAPLVGDSADRDGYGAAKVACEQACAQALDDRLLVARAGLIAGHGDPTDRFGYWPARFAGAAEGTPPWAAAPAVLVPADGELWTQTIHARDLAAWLVRCGERGTSGTYNAAGPRHRLDEVLQVCREATGYQGPVVAAQSSWLVEQGVSEYMGPRSLPLWLADRDWLGFSARDTSAAEAAGLTCRPLADLVADSLGWERELGLGRERRAGLSPAEEQDLLAAWTAST